MSVWAHLKHKRKSFIRSINDIYHLFISWALATLSVLRCYLTFALESLPFFTITTFRMFCHLSVICVVYSDLKILSQQKSGINSWKFSCNDLLRLSTWVIKKRMFRFLHSQIFTVSSRTLYEYFRIEKTEKNVPNFKKR